MRTRRTGILSGIKIKSRNELKRIIAYLKQHGKKVVFTNGCFDLLHIGHLAYLEKARLKGDILVVAINSDASVRKIKGRSRPIVPEDERAELIAGLGCVNFVTIFNEITPLKIIALLKPDILIKGSDWKKNTIVGSDVVRAGGGLVETIPLVKGRSTSDLIKRIARKA